MKDQFLHTRVILVYSLFKDTQLLVDRLELNPSLRMDDRQGGAKILFYFGIKFISEFCIWRKSVKKIKKNSPTRIQ